jgi:hypothetical protein
MTCPNCNASETRTEEKPPHVGLYCVSCGRWLRWIRRTDGEVQAQAKPVEKPPQAPKDSTCAHCPELDRVIQELNAVNRELSIIVRALIGGAR